MTIVAVTGMGRSGTMYASQVFGSATGWRCDHEPGRGWRPLAWHCEYLAYQHGRYCTVDSYLRFQFLAPQLSSLCLHRAVIIRDPLEIFQSMFNRGRPRLDHLNESLLALDGILNDDQVIPISFRRFTSDATYRMDTANLLDMNIDASIASPVNSSTPKQMPSNLRRRAEETVGWYVDRYSGLF